MTNNRFLIYINKLIENITNKLININSINQLSLNINFNLFFLYNNVTYYEFSKKKSIYTMYINIKSNLTLILKTYYQTCYSNQSTYFMSKNKRLKCINIKINIVTFIKCVNINVCF